MRKKCSCMPLFILEVFDLKLKLRPSLNLRIIVSLDPYVKLKGLQVTIRWLSELQHWTTVLRVARSIPSGG